MEIDFSSYHLNVLLKEPERLEKSIALLKDQFDESVSNNYDFFIKTCENVSTITDDLESCTENIGELTSDIKKSIDMCNDLRLIAQDTVDSLSKTSSGFRHLSQIQDILQVHSMMRACRVSNYHEEALQLFQSVSRFARQFPGIPSIQSTLTESQKVKQDVAQTLLDSFSGKLKLTDSIQNVNLLKSSEIYSESELRLAFVNGRFQYLHKKLDHLISRSPVFDFDNLTKKYRNAFSKLHTQYSALFSNDDSEDLTIHIAFRKEITNYCRHLKGALEKALDVNDAKQIMQSALYFVSSLSRIGFSFVPLIDSVFYESKWNK
ncbi:conserved oligomeric Golgi complex subunit 8-like [Histomonas meleagridis]|uniref:conserved oligomeric Golgi complex subunit 8-like n=1 Tax=Histomonas meleagridis TaxID=135588 RepID=UPI00355AC1CC|nr:conserved oligomeric Golgi complex subunit 8-like [Histomonas meleagridis]KAH0801465.1 conserved oligomeric Golgi complex subunit 8-like [Histomonas meleagridis]